MTDLRHGTGLGACSDCGRRDDETIDFLVSTAIWNYVMAGQKTTTYTVRPGLFDQRLYPRVEGVGGVVCLECFDKRARAAGISYRRSLVVFGLDCWMGADDEPQMPL